MKKKRLNRKFFLRPTLQVAKDLLGKLLVMETAAGRMVGEINEVEAYIGREDPACHAARGRTKRNEVMFWEGGHAYVYFTYGMYHCLNVVTEEEGAAAAVLIRSIIPLEGEDLMLKNRIKVSGGKKVEIKNLSNGPGKVCMALRLDLRHNGIDLVKDKKFYLLDNGKKVVNFETTPRIGISQGKELEWRFVYSEASGRPRESAKGRRFQN